MQHRTQPIRPMTPAQRATAPREHLAFNFGRGTVPAKGVVDAALAAETAPTFATAPYAEPRDWGYVGLVAFTTVMLLRPQDIVRPLAPLHLAELCAIIGIAPMVLHRFARQLPVFRVTAETIGLILFGLIIVATAPFSVWPGGAIGIFTDIYLKIIVVFVLMMNTLTTPKRLAQITWLIVFCCGVVAFMSLLDYARGRHLVEGGRLGGPVGGTFGNPNDLAMNMVTFLPVPIVIAIGKEHTVVRRLTAVAIAVLMLVVIVLTRSRGGAIGLVVTLGLLVLLGGKIRRGFGIAAVVGVLLLAPFVPSSYWDRMASITNENVDRNQYTGSREARRNLLQEGWNTFLAFPLTGVGAGQFQNYNPSSRKEQWHETHNALLQVASETGIMGLLVFAFLIVRAAFATMATRRMLKRPSKRNADDSLRYVLKDEDRRALFAHTVAMTAGLAGWFVCSQFASIAYNWTFYYLLALIIAGRELTRDRLIAARVIQAERMKGVSVPAARRFRSAAHGLA